MEHRVVTQTAFGGPDVLKVERRPAPEPLPTEVQVRVQAAGINPVDAKTRSGLGMARVLGPPPFVLGWDVAGVVEQVGYGVTRFEVGDRVMGMPWFPREAGTYAELVTVPSRQLARIPDTLPDEEAGALPLAGLTAWQALVDCADLGPDQRLLVQAAAGGVGHLAVQIGKSRGAWVAGTASAPNLRYLRELGTDQAVDYTDEKSLTAVGEVDVALDLVGGEVSWRSLRMVRPGGLLVVVAGTVSAELEQAARARGVRVRKMLVEPDYAGLEHLSRLIRQRRLRVSVADAYALEDVGAAHAAIETGRTRGKLVLLP